MKPQKQISVINIALTLVVVLFVISIFSLFSCETLLEPITTLTEGRNCSTVIKQTAPDAATQPDNTNEGDIQVCSLGSWFDYQEYKDAALNGSPLYLLSNPTIGFYTYKRDYDYRSESLIIKLIDSFIPVEIFFPGISGDINGEVPISSYEGNMSWGVSLLKSEDIKYPQIKDIFIHVKYDPRSIEETNNLSDPLKHQSYLITDDPELLSLKENYKYPYAYLKTKINDTDVYMFHFSPNEFKRYEVLSPDFKVIEFDTFVPTTIAFKMNDLEINISIKIRTQYDHEQFGMELSTKEDYEAAMKLITDENYISAVIDNIREYLKSREN